MKVERQYMVRIEVDPHELDVIEDALSTQLIDWSHWSSPPVQKQQTADVLLRAIGSVKRT